MRIHALQTGTALLKPAQQYGRGPGPFRLVNSLIDPTWTPPQPILAWAVEHPEGLIVVDTGETADVMKPGYLPRWHPFYRFGVRLTVDRGDEIDERLKAAGLSASDVRWVVMTHLHTDHAGGLRHFPKAEIVISRREYADATGRLGRLSGYLPQHWPHWLEPLLIDFTDIDPLAPYPGAIALTNAKDVWLAPTPGHTAGHMSVIVVDGDLSIFLAGDTSYTVDAMTDLRVSGVSLNAGVELSTLRSIKKFCDDRKSIYLPSHDPASPHSYFVSGQSCQLAGP